MSNPINKFPNTKKFLQLCALETHLLDYGKKIIKEAKLIRQNGPKCREMGRASGYYAAVTEVRDLIKRNDRF